MDTSTKERRAGTERRTNPRYPCSGWAKLRRNHDSKSEVTGQVTDISLGGFYLQTFSPLPAEVPVEVSIGVGNTEIFAMGVIKTLHPSMGNGVMFTHVQGDNLAALERVIASLANPKQAPPPPAPTQPVPQLKLYPPLEALLKVLEKKALVSREEVLRELVALEKASKNNNSH